MDFVVAFWIGVETILLTGGRDLFLKGKHEYSCETWNPHTQRNINRLEAIQRRATKFILKSKFTKFI